MKKHLFYYYLTAIAALFISFSTISAQESLKIVRGKIDTLKALPGSVHYITGVAPAGSTVYVTEQRLNSIKPVHLVPNSD